MTAPPASVPPQPKDKVFVLPVVVWLVIQLMALAASAARLPLWARPPQPPESHAPQQMLVVQMIAPAMLLGWLMPNLLASGFMILTSAPMLLLAGMLGEIPAGRMALAWCMLCIWLIGLGCWSTGLRNRAQRLIGSAIATVLCLGGPVVRYLGQEEGSTGAGFSAWNWLDVTSPTVSALRAGSGAAWGLIPLLTVLAGGLVVAVLRDRAPAPGYPQT